METRKIVETTAGPLEASSLGRILSHEHMLIATEAWRYHFPHVFDASRDHEQCLEAVRLMQSHGVNAICEPGCMDLGRSAELLARITDETGFVFVLASGIYGTGNALLPSVLTHFYDADALAAVFLHDLDEGIQGTSVKAHFLKCAADEAGITPDIEKVHRAVGRAAARFGAPIMIHSRPSSRTGLDQMGILVEEGVDPRTVQVAHTGDADDLDYIEELLATGCFIGMDRFGWFAPLSDDRREGIVAELVRRGHGDRMTISQDAVAACDLPPGVMGTLASARHHGYLFEVTIPRLLDAGVEQRQVDDMMGGNVIAWLTSARSAH